MISIMPNICPIDFIIKTEDLVIALLPTVQSNLHFKSEVGFHDKGLLNMSPWIYSNKHF